MSHFKNNHRDSLNTPIGYRHAPHNWEYDNAALREAASIPPTEAINVSNLKKLALQIDDNSLWMLIDSVEDAENPGTYIPTWKSVGGSVGNNRAGYTYFGLRCNSVAIPGHWATLAEAQFFTSTGLQLLLFATSGTTVGRFDGSAPDATLPFLLYTQADTIYTGGQNILLEDIDWFQIYTGYAEYGSFVNFDLVASMDGLSWVTIQSYINYSAQGTWRSFYINKHPIWVATLNSNTASQENGVPYTNFSWDVLQDSDVAYWDSSTLLLLFSGIYKITVQAHVVPVDSYYIIQNGRQETTVSAALPGFNKATSTSADSDSSSPYSPEPVIAWSNDFIVNSSNPTTPVDIALAFSNAYTGYSGINYRVLVMVELL